MQIKEVFGLAHGSSNATYKTPEASAPSSDVSFFSSALESSAQPMGAADRQPNSNILSQASGVLTDSTRRMSKSLLAFSKKDNEKEMSQYPSHLSNTLLLTHVLVKGVGKTSQCIEKISNLQ